MAHYYSLNPEETKYALRHSATPSSSSWDTSISHRLFNEGPIILHANDYEFRGAGVLVVDFDRSLYVRWDMPYTLIVICMQCDDNVCRDTFKTKCELNRTILQRYLDSIDHRHHHAQHQIFNIGCGECFEEQREEEEEQEPWQIYNDENNEEIYFRRQLVHRHRNDEDLRRLFLECGHLALFHRCCSDVMVVRMTRDTASLLYCTWAGRADTLFRILCLECGRTHDVQCSVSQLDPIPMIRYVLGMNCICLSEKKKK